MGALDGKVAIITGSGHGLGRAHALMFARECARGIVVNDIGVGIEEKASPSPESAEETVKQLKALGCDAVAVFGDCAEMAIGQRMVNLALERWGKLDVLVNNAGNLRDRMIFHMTEQDWDKVIRVHLKGHFATTRFATEYWRNEFKAGSPVAGRIINTTSVAGLFGNAGQPNYAAAKAGIIGFTLALAFSMGRYGVTANAIAPAAETAPEVQIDGVSRELRDAMKPEQVSPLVAYLASDLAGHINGRIFHAAGGRIDHVTHHVLTKWLLKRDEPWGVNELHEAFGNHDLGHNPQPMQAMMTDLAKDLVGDRSR